MRAGLKRLAAASQLWMTWMADAMSYLYTDMMLMSRKIIMSVKIRSASHLAVICGLRERGFGARAGQSL